MLHYKAVVWDSENRTTYRLEADSKWRWSLFVGNERIAFTQTMSNPNMLLDGGTVTIRFEENELHIPQQLFSRDTHELPVLNERPLELTEWWFRGHTHPEELVQYQNGKRVTV